MTLSIFQMVRKYHFNLLISDLIKSFFATSEELLEELEKFKAQRGMTEEQFTIAKVIRRRGKNKVTLH